MPEQDCNLIMMKTKNSFSQTEFFFSRLTLRIEIFEQLFRRFKSPPTQSPKPVLASIEV
jgi:hypothetical protein